MEIHQGTGGAREDQRSLVRGALRARFYSDACRGIGGPDEDVALGEVHHYGSIRSASQRDAATDEAERPRQAQRIDRSGFSLNKALNPAVS